MGARQVDAGTFTVPAHVVSSLPQSSPDSIAIGVLLFLGNITLPKSASFTAPGLSTASFFAAQFAFQNTLFQ